MEQLSGASESNAGDDFHIIWACLRALNLISPKSDLLKIVVEDIAKEDLRGTNPESFLTADLAEYFINSGLPPDIISLDTVDRVVISQLKYSTRHQTKGWTAARLCEKSGVKSKRSIISRFSDSFIELSEKYGRDETLSKLKIKLVSNQPIASSFLDMLEAINCYLTKIDISRTIQYAELKRSIDNQYNADLERLKEACNKLKSSQFVDFLRVIDFNDCDVENRVVLRCKLKGKISSNFIAFDDIDPALLSLYELVSQQALPSYKPLYLEKENVFHALGVHDKYSLFPAPSLFELQEKHISTLSEKELANLIISSKSRMIVAHGVAGVGKTTVVQSIKLHLPEGSEVFLYDCYGQGDYRKSKEERHSDQRALQQISNDIALRLGNNWLIKVPPRLADLRRDFNQKIKQASTLLSNREALLVIVIDAADNSVFASKERGNDCFVPVMWELDLSDNIRLVMSARSGSRTKSLQHPDNADLFEIKGFNSEESVKHVKQFFPTASPTQCKEFHEQTYGVPRAQYYSLKSATTLETILENRSKSLDELFTDRWEAASLEVADIPLQYLSILATPLPVFILKVLWEVSSTQEVVTIVKNLEPGIVLNAGYIGFRDEDFETFIHNKITDEQTRIKLHAEIAHKLEKINDINIYATTNLARHYELGDCKKKLLALGLSDKSISTTDDELLKLEILQNTRLRAIQVADQINHKADVIRLLQLSVEAQRSYEAVTDIVNQNPELSILYADPAITAKLYLGNEAHGQNEQWGEAHLRCASMLSQYPESQNKATHHLKMGKAWLSYWIGLSNEQQDRMRISDDLISSLITATFRLKGQLVAYKELNRWKPFSAVLRVSWLVAQSIVDEIRPEELEKNWNKRVFHPLVRGLFLVALWKKKIPISVSLATEVAVQLNTFFSKEEKHFFPETPRYSTYDKSGDRYLNARTIALVESLASLKVERSLIIQIIHYLPYNLPEILPDIHMDPFVLGNVMRIRVLSSALNGSQLKYEAFLPDKYLKILNGDNNPSCSNESEDQKKYVEEVKRLLPVLEWRNYCLLYTPSIDDEAFIVRLLLREYSSRHFRGRTDEPDFGYKAWAKWLIEGILLCEGTNSILINKIVERGRKAFRKAIMVMLRDLSHYLITDSRYRDIAIDLLEEAVLLNKQSLVAAPEKRDFFIECTEIVHSYDEELARDFFQLAIKSTHLIDITSMPILNYQVNLAKAITSDSSLEQSNLANRFARIIPVYESLIESDYPEVFSATRAISAINHLSPQVGAVALIQWDAYDYHSLSSMVSGYLTNLLQEAKITPQEAVSLCYLSDDKNTLFIALLDQAHKLNQGVTEIEKLVCIISGMIHKDLPIASRSLSSQKVIDWLNEHQYKNFKVYSDLVSLHEFASNLEITENYRTHRNERKEENKYEKLISNLPTPWIDNMDDIYRIVQKEEYPQPYVHVFKTIGNSICRSERIKYLESYIELPFNGFAIESVLNQIKECFDLWANDSKVRKWKEKGVKKFIIRFLPDLIPYEYHGDKWLIQACQLLPENLDKSWSLWLEAIRENIDRLSSWQINLLTSRLVADLAQSDKIELLEWSLQRSEDILAKYDQTLPALYSIEENQPSLAMLLWTLLGHPEKEMRWRAMHSIRILVETYNSLILHQMLAINFNTPQSSLTQNPIEFYWLSARQYLYLLTARIAHEKPAYLLGFVEPIFKQATSLEFPHAYIRHMAAETLLTISKKIPKTITDEQQNELLMIQRPSFDFDESQQFVKSPMGQKRNNQRITFDPMDTEPYWFEDVCRIFGIDIATMCQKAEHWICDVWNKTDEDLGWKNGNGYKKQWDYTLTGNRHGSLPTVEIPKLYWPFHAMYMVAGNLADQNCDKNIPAKKDWDNDWQSFLEFKIPQCKFWFSDTLTSTPLVPEYWGKLPDTIEGKKYTDIDFLTILQPKVHNKKQYFPLHKSISTWSSNTSSTISVETALVSLDKANALMRALQQEKNPYNYRIPPEGSDLEINIAGFHLQGIVKEWQLSQPIENQNPLNRGLGEDQVFDLPSALLTQHFHLVPDFTMQQYFSNNGNQKKHIIFTEKWTDNPQEQNYISTPFSEGAITWIEIDSLLDFISIRNQALIIEVQIDRNKEKNSGISGENYTSTPPQHRIFFLRGNGSLETVERSFHLRKQAY